MELTQDALIQVKGISKNFPGVKALDQIDFSIKKGEIHGLVGENGAGKSTFIKILMGVYERDEGVIIFNGKEVEVKNPLEARQLGLTAMYQDVMIAEKLTVGENFFIGKIPTKFGFVDWKRIFEESRKTLDSLGLSHIDPRLTIMDLSFGDQAMVAIAKVVRDKAHLVIFDEPTARLTNEETETLFTLIKKLKSQGLAIIYISHRMEEIFEICDRVTVFRDGKKVTTLDSKEVDENRLVSLMVGRKLEEMYAIEHMSPGEVALEVRNLTNEPNFRHVNFELRKGEVLGLYGLIGAGRSALLRSIFGANPIDEGAIIINGKLCNVNSTNCAMRMGIGLVPEDRKIQGLATPLTIRHNINISSYPDISRFGFINIHEERLRSKKFVHELNIRTPSIEKTVNQLSGGNQQKVSIAKWLSKNVDILMLDEPTTGVDIGAKIEIYRLIEALTRQGKAVIVCSSYLPEVIGLADRIMVLAEGEVMGIVPRHEANEELLVSLASKVRIQNNGIMNKN
jgi:ribose transport system ATP-binding protein